jgi:hypothetical protein
MAAPRLKVFSLMNFRGEGKNCASFWSTMAFRDLSWCSLPSRATRIWPYERFLPMRLSCELVG